MGEDSILRIHLMSSLTNMFLTTRTTRANWCIIMRTAITYLIQKEPETEITKHHVTK